MHAVDKAGARQMYDEGAGRFADVARIAAGLSGDQRDWASLHAALRRCRQWVETHQSFFWAIWDLAKRNAAHSNVGALYLGVSESGPVRQNWLESASMPDAQQLKGLVDCHERMASALRTAAGQVG